MNAIRGPRTLRCVVCAGASGHDPISGDGALVCIACVWRLGRAAGSPEELTVTEAVVLEEMHGDIVTLEPCSKHRYCWRWDRTWPDVGEAA